MVRVKKETRKTENDNSRKVALEKRTNNLLKKAYELSVLCDAEVAVIIFSKTGKLYEFASSSMQQILANYRKCVVPSGSSRAEPKEEVKQGTEQEEAFKEEIRKLKMETLLLKGKELHIVGMKELKLLEQQLTQGLYSVRKRKEELMREELEQSKAKEQNAVRENATLRRQMEELGMFRPATTAPAPLFIDCCPGEKTGPLPKNNSESPDAVHDFGTANDDSDTTLQLGLPSGSYGKRNLPETEEIAEGETGKRARYRTSEDQID